MESEATIREFTRQAPAFEAEGSHFHNQDLLAWIASAIAVGPDDRVLDVAGGTGALGRHLGREARLSVVVDLTPAMLREGARAAREEGRADVVFVAGDAAALPFPERHFDVVVCRFALHHFPDVAGPLREMRRVCRAQGSVTLIDIVAEPGATGERSDELERLRDPSHGRSLREEELGGLLEQSGLRLVHSHSREQSLGAERWLERARPSEAAHRDVLAALRAEAGGGPATGLHAALHGDELRISHRYLMLGCCPA